MHHDIAIAAAEAGKMILCEKPLARNTKEAEAMVDAVEKAGVANTVWYNYRRVRRSPCSSSYRRGPARADLPLPRQLPPGLDDLADLPQGGAGLWRLDVKAAGSGVTGDLLAHCIDTALWLNGPITDVSAMTETFIKERKHTCTGKVEPVRIDDACAVPLPLRQRLARRSSSRPATPAVTRPSTRSRSTASKPRSSWDLHDLHRLEYFDHRDEDGSAAGGTSTSPTATSPT